MAGGSGSQQISGGTAGYQSLINEALQAWQQFQPLLAYVVPQLQNFNTTMQQNMQGVPNAMSEAVQAPVKAQTQQDIATIQNQQGGTGNPNALYEQMAMSGTQQAGLASDQLVTQSAGDFLSSNSQLENIMNMLQSFSGQGLNAGAGGEANIGLNLSQQSNQMWESIISALGGAAGMALGGPPKPSTAATGGINTSMVTQPPMNLPPLNAPAASAATSSTIPAAASTGVMPTMTQAGASAPISAGAGGSGASGTTAPLSAYYEQMYNQPAP